MKKILKAFLIMVMIFVVGMGGMLFFMTRGLNEGAKVTVNPVEASSLEDGVYTGRYESGRFTNEVKVTVQNQKITKIDVIKDVMFVKPEITKELFNKVILEQSTDVDVISGGTVTCKAYLKAIENALNK